METDNVGMDVPVKFGDSRSNGFRGADFVSNERTSIKVIFNYFVLLDEAIASRAVFVIVSRSDRRAETLLEPAK